MQVKLSRSLPLPVLTRSKNDFRLRWICLKSRWTHNCRGGPLWPPLLGINPCRKGWPQRSTPTVAWIASVPGANCQFLNGKSEDLSRYCEIRHGILRFRYGISENLKGICKDSDRNSRIREAVYEIRSRIFQFPEENSQILEGIWSILEGKRRLKNRSRKIQCGENRI